MADNNATQFSNGPKDPALEPEKSKDSISPSNNEGGEKNETEVDANVVTMVDVLEDETALEEDAKAVLGGADDKNCTYLSGGYMKRQPLYACLTCIPTDTLSTNGGGEAEGKKNYALSGGICLACSYQCHEGHDLIELYTKRGFRCDCGNDKFPKEAKCKIDDKKEPKNEDNKYNQNFAGLYCTCHRPYPDPEDPVSDEMIQCIVCEDWFHGRHLGIDKADLPKDSSYSEMICRDCVSKYQVLNAYKDFAVNLNQQSADEVKVDVLNDSQGPVNDSVCPVKNQASESTEVGEKVAHSMFLTGDWRSHICKCTDCEVLFKENGLEFLLDPEDTVHHYEAKSKAQGSQYEEGMKALSEMDRVKQVEAIQSYNSMKGNLMEYLKKFATNGKVVREEDIQEFFQAMKSSKKQKTEIPKFCR